MSHTYTVYIKNYKRFHFMSTVIAPTIDDAAQRFFDLTGRSECYISVGSEFVYFQRDEVMA